jgi:hypothetical protein
MEGVDIVSVAVRILGGRPTVRPDGEPVPPADESQNVVERMVLHHHHDNVFDLWDLISSWWEIRSGSRTRRLEPLPPDRGRGGDRGGSTSTAREHHRGTEHTSTDELPSVQFHQLTSRFPLGWTGRSLAPANNQVLRI